MLIKKVLLLSLLFISVAYGKLLYSVQLATFMSREDALVGLKRLQIEPKKLFLYRTDKGYWTVRTKLSNRYEDLKDVIKLSKSKYIRRGIVVATSSKKIEWLVPNKEPEDIKKSRVIEKKETLNRSDIAKTLNEFFKSDEVSEDRETLSREDVFISRIKDLQKRDSKIESFTFYIKTEHIFYVVQFGEYPFSESSNIIYKEKPRIQQDSSITMSNANGSMIIRFNTLENSKRVESAIKRVINVSRRTENIRIKAYKINSR